MRPAMLELGVKTLIAYLLGALIGSLIVGKLRGGVDIRKLGSGNPGGTNALRTQGPWFALGVIIIDVGKGWLAAGWVPGADLPVIGIDPTIERDWLNVACASAAVLGHVYPVWYGFRGGKGAATLVGVLLGVMPKAVLPIFILWLLVIMITGFVSLATLLAVAAFPAYLVITGNLASTALVTFACVMAIFVCYTHRANIERLYNGTETRAQRLWLLRSR